jgi:hypothetical protein
MKNVKPLVLLVETVSVYCRNGTQTTVGVDTRAGKLDWIRHNCRSRTEGPGTCPKELITHGATPPLNPSFHGVSQKYVEGKLNKIFKT